MGNKLHPNVESYPTNRPSHILCTIIKNVMTSSVKAYIGVIFTNLHILYFIFHMHRPYLKKRHPKPPTPIITYNSATEIIINNNTRQEKMHSINFFLLNHINIKTKPLSHIFLTRYPKICILLH